MMGFRFSPKVTFNVCTIQTMSLYNMKLMDEAKSLKNSINPTPFPRGHAVIILMCTSENIILYIYKPKWAHRRNVVLC